MQSSTDKQRIGRLEHIDLPELGLFGLDAKVDTGAYTSSLHCHEIVTKTSDGQLWVSFKVLDPSHPEYKDTPYRAKVHRRKRVRSSNGMIEERVIIKQKVILAGRKGVIQLSLTNRSEMKYPVLIGRRFLTGKFVVDVSETYLN